MKDETYVFIQDVKEKKTTARSARYARTHNGKSGRVKLPCDYLTQKELKAMSGECKSYRLNEPMNWEEFKAMPDDIKVTYIKILREKFNVPDSELYRMFGTNKDTLSRFFKVLGLRLPRRPAHREWKKDEWFAWANGVDVEIIKSADPFVDDPETPLPCSDGFHCDINEASKDSEEPEVPEEPEEPKVIPKHIANVGKKVERKPAIPIRGELTFCGSAEDALKTAAVLLGGANVQISLSWEVIEDAND